MEQPIALSTLNDFIFCPASIYFHGLYEDLSTALYQSASQLNGKAAHTAVDTGRYSTRKNILQGISVYSSTYNIYGKIDVFDADDGFLVERKKKIVTIYDGYVFQVYGQCFALRDMGYSVNRIRLHSMDDNRNYDIPLPENDPEMKAKFESLIIKMNHFELNDFTQSNPEKCNNCIYNPYCDRCLIENL